MNLPKLRLPFAGGFLPTSGSSSDDLSALDPVESSVEKPADTIRKGDSCAGLCGSVKLKYHLLSPRSAASLSSASVRLCSSAASASSTACASDRGVDEGVEAYELLERRCFLEGGSVGVLGDELGDAAPRCMNFMVRSREDIVFPALFGCAMMLASAWIEYCSSLAARAVDASQQAHNIVERSQEVVLDLENTRPNRASLGFAEGCRKAC